MREARARRPLPRQSARVLLDDATLDDAEWLLRARRRSRIPAPSSFAYETAWPCVQEFFPEQMTPDGASVRRCATRADPGAVRKLSEPPLVLAHGDWRLDNLFFTPDDEVIAVDWQLIDRSVGPRETSRTS